MHEQRETHGPMQMSVGHMAAYAAGLSYGDRTSWPSSQPDLRGAGPGRWYQNNLKQRKEKCIEVLNLRYRYSIPRSTCSFLSSQTVLPEQEHTVLSLSQTPALRAITPTRVSGSPLSN